MSDLYNELIDELEKNDIFVRYSTIEPKTILDLSEHDKPFKVKIRELEESYQKNVREIHTLEKDNLFFKQRITEIENKRNKMYEISKILRNNCNNFYKENKELKQRIAELESENEKLFDYLNGITGNTKEEMDIILNTLDFELQNNKVSVLKENEKVVGLDFSKHDEAFENEIAGLKAKIAIKDMDYKTASELLGKYQHENEALKKRIQELDTIDAIRIDEKRELKQHIAELERKNNQLTESILRKETKIHELESKETENPTKINLNDRIKVKLTPLGAEIYYHQCDDVNKKIKENGGTELEPIMPQIDKDGYTEFQLWHFMELYGKHIGMCKPNVISPLDIVVSE